MRAHLEEIKPITVRNQEFMITVLKISMGEERMALEKSDYHIKTGLSLSLNDFFNAYVYLPHLTDKYAEEIANQTYREGKVLGVDTRHSYNDNMSLEEKKQDAYRQIVDIIENYLDLLSDVREVIKMRE